jgi:hypothetical protein
VTYTLKDMQAAMDADLERLGPAEWAFAELLAVAAFGLAVRENRDPIREQTLKARRMFREQNGSCVGCGHEPHDPAEGEIYRKCDACVGAARRYCGAWRNEDDTIRYS